MPRFYVSLPIALLTVVLVACSSDKPPLDAVEGELSVAMTLGKFDPNYGRIGETILFVKIDGKEYRLESREGSEVIGFDDVRSLTELGGRRVLVAGEIDRDTYYASYTKLLPDEESDDPSFFAQKAQEEAAPNLTVPAGATSVEIMGLVRESDILSGALESAPLYEGWLAPGDYVVAPGTARSELIRMMIDRQEGILGAMWDYRDPLPLANSTDLLVLASLVEAVAPEPEYLEPVASVFVNRLRRGMRLQLDATVIYGITRGEPLERPLTHADLKRDTPWNTYIHGGLPPTPICNPSMAALGAASHPPPTEYLFFVSDAEGGLTFAKTLKEHNLNMASFREAMAEKGK